MLEYEAMRPLSKVFAMLKTSKKHWSDNFEWTIVEFMHQKVLRTTRIAIGATCYIALSCDKVSIT
jgi:hypothetical protein